MINEKDQLSFNCPGCELELVLVPRMKVTQLSSENSRSLDVARQEGHLLSPECSCPKCGHGVQVRYQVTLLEVVNLQRRFNSPEHLTVPPGEQSEPHPNNWSAATLSPEEISFVGQCEANGLMGAFAQVVRDQTHVLHRPPTDLGKFLITFLRTAVLVPKLPPPIVREFTKEFPGRIQFWKAQGIGMVLSDGKICRFVPMRAMVVGKEAKSRNHRLEVNGMDVHRVESFDYISRTGHGYVPEGARIFIESLRHSIGDRGREMKGVPLRPNVAK